MTTKNVNTVATAGLTAHDLESGLPVNANVTTNGTTLGTSAPYQELLDSASFGANQSFAAPIYNLGSNPASFKNRNGSGGGHIDVLLYDNHVVVREVISGSAINSGSGTWTPTAGIVGELRSNGSTATFLAGGVAIASTTLSTVLGAGQMGFAWADTTGPRFGPMTYGDFVAAAVPTVTSVAASASGQNVTVTATVTTAAALLSCTAALTGASHTYGPTAMTVTGSGPYSVSYTFNACAADTYTPSVTATNSGGPTGATGPAETVYEIGGGGTAPDPTTTLAITSGTSFTTPENSTATIGTITATGTAPVTFSITGGADAARFSINSTTGALSPVLAFDFESPTDSGSNNVYDLQVTASDISGTVNQSITVTVTNVTEGTTAETIALSPPAFSVVSGEVRRVYVSVKLGATPVSGRTVAASVSSGPATVSTPAATNSDGQTYFDLTATGTGRIVVNVT